MKLHHTLLGLTVLAISTVVASAQTQTPTPTPPTERAPQAESPEAFLQRIMYLPPSRRTQLSLAEHTRIADVAQSFSTIVSLQALRTNRDNALRQKIASLCSAPTAHQMLFDRTVQNNRTTLDRIAALDASVTAAQAADALATQRVAVFPSPSDPMVYVNIPACISPTVQIAIDQASLAQLQTDVPGMRAPARRAQQGVRLVQAVSPPAANCGERAAEFPFNGRDIWGRVLAERAKLPEAARAQATVIGLIDSGVMGPNAQWPEGVFAVRDGVDKYGNDTGGRGYIRPDPNDPNRAHGTAVADILTGGGDFRAAVLANGNNADFPVRLRVYALGPNVEIAPTVALLGVDYLMETTPETIRPSIINLSLEQSTANNRWQTAIDDQRNGQKLFVAAAGNRSIGATAARDLMEDSVYPAAIAPRKNLITVAALDRTLALAPFSNYSGEIVELAAPGCRLRVMDDTFAPQAMSGTSFAAPQVSFAAALIATLSATPPDSWEIKERLILSADFRPQLATQVRLGAVLNIARAISVNSDVLTIGDSILTGTLPNNAREALAGACTTPLLNQVPVINGLPLIGKRNRRVVATRANNGFGIQRYYIADQGKIGAGGPGCTQNFRAGLLMFRVDGQAQPIDLATLDSFDVLLRENTRP